MLIDCHTHAFAEKIAPRAIQQLNEYYRLRTPFVSTPHKLAAILDRFPKMRAIAAHMGGYTFWQEASESLIGRNVYLDTSSTFPYIDPSVLRTILSKHSKDLILFGSDYPLRAPQEDLPILDAIPWLTDDEKERIRGKNVAGLLGLT